MNRTTIINYSIAIVRIYLALVFILSGLDKINDLQTFSNSIMNYKILPIYLVNILAIVIPWIEVITGAFLLLGIYIKENSLIAFSLLIVFTIAILSAVVRGLDIECGCMGTSDGQRVGLLKIIENLALTQIFPSGWEIINTRVYDLDIFDSPELFLRYHRELSLDL